MPLRRLHLKTFTDGDSIVKKEYTRIYAGFGGIDVTNDDSNVTITRFPYLVNMWRDFRSENGAAIETFPGWRLIPWTTDYSGRINGLYGASFDGEKYLIIHKGQYLYAQPIRYRNETREVRYIAMIADTGSKGFQHGEAFYILDTQTIWRIIYNGSGFKCEEVGMGAYIPTTYSDGYEYEQRNMLTNEFFIKYNIQKPEETSLPDNELTFAVLDEAAGTAKVTGIKREVKNLYIPDTCYIKGKLYRVTTIADKAFQARSMETVVIAKGVETIGDTANSNGTSGPFYSCKELRRVVLHGARTISQGCFGGCSKLGEIFVSDAIESASSAIPSRNIGFLYIYFEGSESQAVSSGIASWNGGSNQAIYNTHLYDTKVGNTINVPYSASGSAEVRLIEKTPGNNLSEAYEYQFKASQQSGLSVDITVKERVGFLWLALDGAATATNIAITATDSYGAFNEEEGALTHYRFDLYEPTYQIKSVTLDGFPTEYELFTEELDGKTYIRSVVLTADKNGLNGKKLVVHGVAYESEFARSKAGEDYKYGNGAYSGTSAEAIKKCTLFAEYDGRIFLSGNPNLPNTVFYTNRNLSGVNDPTYFGQLNYFNDGQGMIPNASLLATPSFLAVLKKDTSGDGTVYYHTAEVTEYDVLPKIYPCTQGVANIGSLGPCANFRDDPVFISKEGLEGISLSAVNSERGIYHRSTTADKWLLAEIESGSAEIAEWEGYLVILVNGKIFLADSRQISKLNGSAQYEWYYIDEVGYYEGQRPLYFFPSSSPYDSAGNKLTDLYIDGIKLEVKEAESEYRGDPSSDRPTYDTEGAMPTTDSVYYVSEIDTDGNTHYYIVSTYGEMIDGTYSPAAAITSIDEMLVIGTESGRLIVVNTDKRGESYLGDQVARDKIHATWYTRCNRRYISGFATAKDNCEIPHYDKDTVSRSLVIKAKTMSGSGYTVKVRTDREPWEEIQTVVSAAADGNSVDFGNLSFITAEEDIRQLREKKRRWVEKQYYIYSDDYKKPFGIHNIVFRYVISGLNGRIRRG